MCVTSGSPYLLLSTFSASYQEELFTNRLLVVKAFSTDSFKVLAFDCIITNFISGLIFVKIGVIFYSRPIEFDSEIRTLLETKQRYTTWEKIPQLYKPDITFVMLVAVWGFNVF